MKSISLFFQDFVERILIWLGYSGDMLDSLNRWVLLLFIVVFALAVDLVVRVILLHILRHIVSRTKATWDDHIFDKRVMRHLCNFITPTIIYILMPIAFFTLDGTSDDMYDIIKRGVEVWMVISCIRFVNALLKVLFDIAEQRPAWHGKPIKGLMQTGQGIVIGIGAILIISILINKSPALLLTGLGASAAVMMLIFKKRRGIASTSSKMVWG
jgi:miniconductance mechanosensitive channel